MFPKHRKIRAKSRGVDVNEMKNGYIMCETEWCRKRASSIHHAESSFRGERKDVPENLIALCYDCHEWFHSHPTRENREKILQRIKFILKRKNDIFAD